MECLVIDWKSIDGTFVKDETYEFQAPKWLDFTAPESPPLDAQDWFCGKAGCAQHAKATTLPAQSIILKEASEREETANEADIQGGKPRKKRSLEMQQAAEAATAATMAPLAEKALCGNNAPAKKGRMLSKSIAFSSSLNQSTRSRKAAAGGAPLRSIFITKEKTLSNQIPSSKSGLLLTKQHNNNSNNNNNKQASENDNPNGSNLMKEKEEGGVEVGGATRDPLTVNLSIMNKAPMQESVFAAKKKGVARMSEKCNTNLAELDHNRHPYQNRGGLVRQSARLAGAGAGAISIASSVNRSVSAKHASSANLPGIIAGKKKITVVVPRCPLPANNSGNGNALSSSINPNRNNSTTAITTASTTNMRKPPLWSVSTTSGLPSNNSSIANPPSRMHRVTVLASKQGAFTARRTLRGGQSNNGNGEINSLSLTAKRIREKEVTQKDARRMDCTLTKKKNTEEEEKREEDVVKQEGPSQKGKIPEKEVEEEAKENSKGEEKDCIPDVLKQNTASHIEQEIPSVDDNHQKEERQIENEEEEEKSVLRENPQLESNLESEKMLTTDDNEEEKDLLQRLSIVSAANTDDSLPCSTKSEDLRATRPKLQWTLRSRGKKRKSTEMNFKVNCANAIPTRKATQNPAGASVSLKAISSQPPAATTIPSAILKEHAVILHKKQKTARTIQTSTKPFRLRTEERGALRQGELAKEKSTATTELRVEEEEEEDVKKQKETEEVLHPHARRMPDFAHPFKPRRSTKKLTIPREPNFHVTKARKTCIKHAPPS